MADAKPSQGDAELLHLALELVERHAAGAADVRRKQVTDDLLEVRITPRRRSAAEVSLVLVGDDEVSGAVGAAGFYCDWGDAEAVAHLREVLEMTLLGRVETIGWLGEPTLRVYPLKGRPYNIGALSLIPWRLRRRRRFDPYKA